MRCAFKLLLISSLFLGCRRDDSIQTYRVSKEEDRPAATGPVMPTDAAPSNTPLLDPSPSEAVDSRPVAMPAPSGDMNAMGSQMGLAPAASSKEVTWTVPIGWQVQPPSVMRIGSFKISGDNGQEAEFSVIPLSGDAGGYLANINRWRGQLNLEPISEDQLSDVIQKRSFSGRPMLWVEFPSREKLINNQYRRRLISVIYKQGERSWFFKMMGEDKTVQSAKPALRSFLNSLKFQSGS